MTDDRIQIYSKAKFILENETNILQHENISEVNKKWITKFVNFNISKGLSILRCRKLSGCLRRICLLLNKDLTNLDKDDLTELFVKIKSHKEHSEATKQDYIVITKQFFKWYEDEDERIFDDNTIIRRRATLLYKHLKKIGVTSCRKKIRPADILVDEDIKTALQYCYNTRDRAFIRLLHETGARAGEFLNIRIKHIVFEDDGRAKLHLDGKTGERRIPIVYSVPLIRQLLQEHRFKEDPNSPLWWCDPHSNNDGPLLYKGASKMIDTVWKRIPNNNPISNKTHNLHFFRHSRATLLAPKMTESLLCKYFGWTIGSKQVKTYVHLSPEDLDNVYFDNMGLENKSKKIDAKPKKCIFCCAINDIINDYCHRCGRPLDTEVVIKEDIKLERQKNETYSILAELMKTPDFQKFVKDKGIHV
jgi:integrase